MKNSRKLCRAIFLFAIIAVLGILQAAPAAADVAVEEITPVYVEKGSTNYTITVRAIVTNKGEDGNVVIDVAAVDEEGFQLKTFKLSGYIEKGKKKLLIDRVDMEKSVYSQIADWEWAK
ncbi:MAG: hypothetical protein ACLFRF_02415 [Desulfobacterales bacterium]